LHHIKNAKHKLIVNAISLIYSHKEYLLINPNIKSLHKKCLHLNHFNHNYQVCLKLIFQLMLLLNYRTNLIFQMQNLNNRKEI
jgi:hypothetical protein